LNLVSAQTQGHWIFDSEIGDYKWIPDEVEATKLFVKEVNEAERTVTLKFKGAPSGDYSVFISSTIAGRLDTENLQIRTEAKVTGFSPSQGSALGGSIVTITGENFSEHLLDNQVLIGDALCIVQTASTTQIVCQIERREVITDFSLNYPADAPVSVFLKVAETAACTAVPCTFKYVEPSAEVTTFTRAYEEAELEYVVTVEGSGFGTSTVGARMFIDNVQTETLSVEDTTARFKVKGILHRQSTNLELYFEEGLPKGYDTEIESQTLWAGFRMYRIEPSVGSLGGTRVTVSASCYGADVDLTGTTV
jgi:hypothetical protein